MNCFRHITVSTLYKGYKYYKYNSKDKKIIKATAAWTVSWMPTYANCSKCLMTERDPISETLCLKKSKIMDTSKITQSSEAFKSALNSMTLNLGVDNITPVSGTSRLRTPPLNSLMKLDENTLDKTSDKCVTSMKNANEISSDDTTCAVHNRLFREHYASVQILSIHSSSQFSSMNREAKTIGSQFRASIPKLRFAVPSWDKQIL